MKARGTTQQRVGGGGNEDLRGEGRYATRTMGLSYSTSGESESHYRRLDMEADLMGKTTGVGIDQKKHEAEAQTQLDTVFLPIITFEEKTTLKLVGRERKQLSSKWREGGEDFSGVWGSRKGMLRNLLQPQPKGNNLKTGRRMLLNTLHCRVLRNHKSCKLFKHRDQKTTRRKEKERCDKKGKVGAEGTRKRGVGKSEKERGPWPGVRKLGGRRSRWQQSTKYPSNGGGKLVLLTSGLQKDRGRG